MIRALLLGAACQQAYSDFAEACSPDSTDDERRDREAVARAMAELLSEELALAVTRRCSDGLGDVIPWAASGWNPDGMTGVDPLADYPAFVKEQEARFASGDDRSPTRGDDSLPPRPRP